MVSKRQLKVVAKWAMESPSLLLRELNRLYYTRGYKREYNPNGIDVMAADWDNLLILDACRYDLFEQHHNLPGTLSAKQSRAAHTSEFILGNFHEQDLTDTVYVTASPILERGYPEKYNPQFHHVVNVWQEHGWDDDCNSVRPETMREYALDAAATYPDKRIIVHFMQPHYPFIGSDLRLDMQSVPDPEEITTDIWHEMMRKRADISKSDIVDAYETNFELVHATVETLLSELSGKTVVTSDHGNMLGERSNPVPNTEWGHPPGLYTSELVTVPWLEYTNGSRREILAEPPAGRTADTDEDLVRERLRQLGYAE